MYGLNHECFHLPSLCITYLCLVSFLRNNALFQRRKIADERISLCSLTFTHSRQVYVSAVIYQIRKESTWGRKPHPPSNSEYDPNFFL